MALMVRSFFIICFLLSLTARADVLDRIDWTNYEVNVAVDSEGQLSVKEVHTIYVRGSIDSISIPLNLEGDQKAQIIELYQYIVLPKVEKIIYRPATEPSIHSYIFKDNTLEWFFRTSKKDVDGKSAENSGLTLTFHLSYRIDKSLSKDNMGYYRVKRKIGPNSKIGRIRNFLVNATIDEKKWTAADPLPKGTEFFDVSGGHIYNLNLKLAKKDKDKNATNNAEKKEFIIACKIKTDIVESSFTLLNTGIPKQYIKWEGEPTITFNGYAQNVPQENSENETQLHFKTVVVSPSPSFSIQEEKSNVDPETILFYRANFEIKKEGHMKFIAQWLGYAYSGAALWPSLKKAPGQYTRTLNLVHNSFTVVETGIAIHVGSDKILAANIEGEALAGYMLPQKMEVTLNTTLVQGVKAMVELENCQNYL
jgi:hypothetical protein